jgi:ribosomal protein S18 acetylase RimI-like enzyme
MTRLATLPKYQRHGLGTALTNWGLEICQQRNISAGLFSTSIAKQLYDHLGFKLLKDIVVQVPGEEEKVVMACMKWDPVA